MYHEKNGVTVNLVWLILLGNDEKTHVTVKLVWYFLFVLSLFII